MNHARHQPAVPLVEPATVEFDPVPWGHAWRMKDELAFLRALGTWRPRETVVDRAQLLHGYLEGLTRRRRWTDLQREPLECEARLLMEELKARPMGKSA